jgi:hypothetical protein
MMTHKQIEIQDLLIEYGNDRARLAFALLMTRGWCIWWAIAAGLFAFLWVCEKWFW